jgi:hypothetical protein
MDDLTTLYFLMAFAGAGVFFSITFGVAKLIYQDRTGYRHILGILRTSRRRAGPNIRLKCIGQAIMEENQNANTPGGHGNRQTERGRHEDSDARNGVRNIVSSLGIGD